MILDGEFTLCAAYGWQGGPEFNTMLQGLQNGSERRRPKWDRVRHRFSLPFQNITDAAYLTQLKGLFLVAYGRTHSFFVKDEADYRAVNQEFGVGDGAETDFSLSVTSTFGTFEYVRSILYPVNPTFTVNGAPATASYNSATQKVEFAVAPPDFAILRWTGEFRILVRFDSDYLPMSIDSRSGENLMMNGSIELVEVTDVQEIVS